LSDVLGIGGVANAAGTVAAAGLQASATNAATAAAARSADQALQFQRETTARNQGVQDPFIQAGTGALATQGAQQDQYYQNLAPYENALAAAMPGQMTQAQLEQTPGYQFQLAQGLQATQNSAAARGLGVSGAALRGAADYATGLANSNYQQQFANQQQIYGNYQTQLSNQKNILDTAFNQNATRIGVGENAATGSGTQGQLGATNAGNISTGLGGAQVAGSIASGNALSGGVNSLVNQSNQNALIQALNNRGGIFPSGSGTSADQAAAAAAQSGNPNAAGPGF
jgi:hypothetical protein